MNGKDLWKGLNHIDEELIEEAAQEPAKKRFPIPRLAVAGICLVIGIAAYAGLTRLQSPQTTGNAPVQEAAVETAAEEDAEAVMEGAAEEAAPEEALTEAAAEDAVPAAGKGSAAAEDADSGMADVFYVGVADAGTLGEDFTAAKDYGAVYDSVQAWTDELTSIDTGMGDVFYDTEAAMDEAMEEAAPAEQQDIDGFETPMAKSEDAASDGSTATGSATYSRTNVMTEGVDEADIVKTDGKYIYTAKDTSVRITDIRNGRPGKSVLCELPEADSSAQLREIFVDGDTLVLICNSYEMPEELTTWQNLLDDTADYPTERALTAAYVYDITDPLKPVYRGVLQQDGYYSTARKVGEKIYLFSDLSVELPDLEREEALSEEALSSWIPRVNGKPVAADCIYITEKGSTGKLIASADLSNPEHALDAKFVFTDYAQAYVGSGTIYLYYEDWNGGWVSDNVQTKIIALPYADGHIRAGAYGRVAGSIRDSFAISEGNGTLRVLTTSRKNGEDINTLYMLDSGLKETGRISDIAPGEVIYAARYIGKYAYFVTYRNTDPLFVADVSDPKEPKLLGSLEITGFSEYLHPWGNDRLLGIGYETDPKTGDFLGVKLSMFDISDPLRMKTEHTLLLKNVWGGPALDGEYKAVLADEGQNIIGFAWWGEMSEIADAEEMEDLGSSSDIYGFFQYDAKAGFTRETALALQAEDSWMGNARGLYVGQYAYVVNGDKITAYDRENGWKKVTD